MRGEGNARRALSVLCLAAFAVTAEAASSVMIWPLNLAIEAPERAAALWLENTGSDPIDLQVRVLAWDQAEGVDRYRSQIDVVGTPPFARVEPGRRQLIRLTMGRPASPAHEIAYRVLIDEIPTASRSSATNIAERGTASGAALKFLMRYSLPLFVYPGGGDSNTPASARRVDPPLASGLSWRASERDGRWFLHVRNDDAVHARLSQVRVSRPSDQGVVIADGLLGYVLPGAETRWPLALGVTLTAQDELHARLGKRGLPALIPRRP